MTLLSRSRVLLISTVAALVIGGGYLAFGQSYPQPGAPQPQSGVPQPMIPSAAMRAANAPEIITVMASRMGSTVTLGGTVIPYKEVTLTAQIPGRVEMVAGTEGDWFETDDVLVRIDDDDLLAQRRAALADIANTEAAMRNARMQYSRELYSPQSRSITRAPGMGVPSMFDQFFTQPMTNMMPGTQGGTPWVDRHADLYAQGSQINQAESRTLAARSRLDSVEAKLRDTRSVAPFPGVIVSKVVEVGDTVQPGQPMLVYADTRYLQIRVDVPARLMSGMRKGMELPARLDVGDTRVSARVAQIFPAADETRHTVTVKFDLPQGVPGGPGMYAEVMVPDVNAPVSTLPVIPDSAVVWRGSLPGVFVVADDGRSQLRLVRLGDHVGPGAVSVLSGLQVGERLYSRPPPGMASNWVRQSAGQ